ncbi:methyltransferase [Flavobacterium magnum]|uniref:Methyltransferase n=1 Tax=Flavobacterium magnum TaxID=2162713 RepID=A0A2S0RHC7_9FLAO|nr:O-methyltransferase [Flavobacterium magnum]AWA31337.1 methyltransferase [Flavobacterium magnum]
MHFLSDDLEDYIEQHSEKEPELLARLHKETYQKVLLPRMLSGHFQGRVLSMLSKLARPKSILEVGTYTGYATLCLCEGLQQDGVVHTIDIKEELVDFQRRYFDASAWGNRIVQHLGAALDIIPEIDATFDLVFIDADKENYLNYYHMILPKMNQGGLILSDNVLWSGKVVQELQPNDLSTKVLLEYNALLRDDPRVETVLLPIRDGLTVSRVL